MCFEFGMTIEPPPLVEVYVALTVKLVPAPCPRFKDANDQCQRRSRQYHCIDCTAQPPAHTTIRRILRIIAEPLVALGALAPALVHAHAVAPSSGKSYRSFAY